ncbi:MAG: 1-acyl-sn-glycerol-3-phosphate acyltransferase [Porphyromonadaceae bacterium]|nr:1-acyl-sn-glycerol-3-phosphate acyltransferase [Porphyromonadaceae bacterium]
MDIIDIESIAKTKTDKKIPKIVFWLIKKIICLKRINYIIEKYGEQHKGIAFAEKVLDELKIKTDIKGLENIPKDNKLVFVSNHPLGALEALAMGKHLNMMFEGKINFITNEILTYIPPLKDIFIPVTVGGNRQDRVKMEAIENLFVSDNHIILFPSGGISRRTNGKVQDPEWKKMFVTKARLHRRTIVPVFCSGQSSEFFLKFSNFRKKIGIKSNIELILFPREMFKYEGKKIDITVGKPISIDSLGRNKSDYAIAQDIREIVYGLELHKNGTV